MEISQNPMTKMSPKDFFLNLGAMVSLYAVSISLIKLLFEIINRVFRDALSEGYYMVGYYSTGIRWSIAFILIVFPLYIFISWYLGKIFSTEPAKKDLGIRKWLIYLTLFVTGIAVIVDLITLVNYFLNGEITTRFAFKVLAVFIVSGMIFAYYLYDLKSASGSKGHKIFSYISIALVLLSLIGGFFIIGSPMRQRDVRFDQRRVSDLQNIQYQVLNRWQIKGEIPKNLDELSDSISGYTAPVDPLTGEKYSYSKINDTSFKLCSNFSLSSKEANGGDYLTKNGNGVYYAVDSSMPYYPNEQNWNWNHEKGNSCFERTIDKTIYPVRKN